MFIVVDGNNLAHRIFHTPAGELTKKDGTPSGVVYGIVNSIKGYLEKFPETERVIVAWDTKGGSKWRKALYPDYKANRDYGNDDEEKKLAYQGLFMQMEESHKMLHMLGVNSIKIDGYEADDIIALLADELTIRNKHMMVITSDKDMLQLVSDNVSIYSPYKDKIYSPTNFFEELGVTKEAYIGYRALIGDTSDNISGIQGIAEGRAKKLMDEFGHIDNVLNAQGDSLKKLKKSVIFSRIFEPQGLRTLGINNKIMNFKFVPREDTILEDITFEVTTQPVVDSKSFRQWCIDWQLASILVNYLPFISVFNALGEDD